MVLKLRRGEYTSATMADYPLSCEVTLLETSNIEDSGSSLLEIGASKDLRVTMREINYPPPNNKLLSTGLSFTLNS